jgi:hypothetical protein
MELACLKNVTTADHSRVDTWSVAVSTSLITLQNRLHIWTQEVVMELRNIKKLFCFCHNFAFSMVLRNSLIHGSYRNI